MVHHISTGIFYTEALLQTMGGKTKIKAKEQRKQESTDFSLPQKWNKGKEQRVESIPSACL